MSVLRYTLITSTQGAIQYLALVKSPQTEAASQLEDDDDEDVEAEDEDEKDEDVDDEDDDDDCAGDNVDDKDDDVLSVIIILITNLN